MNPTFPAFQKAVMKMSMDMLMGIPYVPKKKALNQTDGKLFAQSDRDDNGFPRSDMVVAMEEAEIEDTVQRHLTQLAKEAKQRYLDECSKYPFVGECHFPNIKADVEKGKHDFPRSDMIVLMEEEQERREAAANACIHTGEHMNLEETGANEGTKFEAQ